MNYRYRRLLTKRSTPLWLVIVILIVWAIQQSGALESAQQAAVTSQPGLYKVTRFVDGDTIEIDMNGTKETVRMIGIDTPETHRPNTPVQCYGPAAAAFTKNTIGNKRVRLEADPKNTNRDRYDRLLRYVYTEDNKFVNRAVIDGGYGFAYLSFPFSKSDEFDSAQAAAQASKKGLWANCHPKLESNGRWQTEAATSR